jgi:hypothetical protein
VREDNSGETSEMESAVDDDDVEEEVDKECE